MSRFVAFWRFWPLFFGVHGGGLESGMLTHLRFFTSLRANCCKWLIEHLKLYRFFIIFIF